ncbi:MULTISPECIES: hypothetical protein [unclassified Nocardiopsis]|uniref:hypothetical protein n=1 Tax=unclassified Nocardiopsis TaxID=2649073 RepID=UPI001915E9E0|nr:MULTISPECIES: hypothetical protein [unclassified Nocardiopsis]
MTPLPDTVAVDWVPPRGGRTAALQWLFTASLPENAEPRLPPDELSDWAWVVPDRLGELLPAHVGGGPSTPESGNGLINSPDCIRLGGSCSCSVAIR